jgi:hypothetical protein
MNATGGSLGSGSLMSVSTQRSFDVTLESDVILLLKFIHQNPLDPTTKNSLRDAVFAFRQEESAGNAALIKDAFAAVGVTVVTGVTLPAGASSRETTKTNGIGSSRPMPRFVPNSVLQAKVLAAQPPAFAVNNEESKASPASEAQPIEQESVVSQPVPSHEEKVSEPDQATQPTISVPFSSPDASARIQEIKRAVNEKVGNPVNLISQHNTVGREYMNALLDAMKKMNGGASGGSAEAMVRLERAFQAVQALDISQGKQERAVPNEETPPPTQSPLNEEKESPQESVGESQIVPIRRVAVQPVVSVSPEVRAQQQESVRMSSVKDTFGIEKKSIDESVVTPIAVASEPKVEANIPSVAKEKQLQDLLRLNRLKDAQGKKSIVEDQVSAMDPLLTPHVTGGLEQLLSEWALFKSSGIFGTGPSGKDHPLYKKISLLTMAAVIAGRFEGATPAIKQSITEYMNGWRYEEGIIHEHGETFEHYLRRVVYHILNKPRSE